MSAEIALRLYRAFVIDTLGLALQSAAAPVRIAFSGDPDPQLVPSSVAVERQQGKDLGERLAHATEAAFRRGIQQLVILGTDSPDLPSQRIQDAFSALDHQDMVLGPAADGGYYLIGLQRNEPGVFHGIDWSTDRVHDQTMKRASECGLSVAQLPSGFDVDHFQDLQRLSQEIRRWRIQGLSFPAQTAELLDLLGL